VDGVQLHTQEIRLASISVGIVAVFITCHTVKWVPNIWELAQLGDQPIADISWPGWLNYITCISHLLTTFNSSVNFYIYSFKHKGRRGSEEFVTAQTQINTLKISRLSASRSQSEILENCSIENIQRDSSRYDTHSRY